MMTGVLSRNADMVTRVTNMSSHRIGMLYLITCTVYALLGLASAVAIQLDMLIPTTQLLGTLWFGKLLTGHGMLMMFFVLLPLFPGVFGFLVLPAAVGATRPMTSKTGFVGWLCHLCGGALVASLLMRNTYDSGWAMMMPVGGTSVSYMLLIVGLVLAVMATLLPSIFIARTVLSRKTRSLPISQLPLFAWFLLLGSIVQILVSPIRLFTLLSLLGSYTWDWSWSNLATPEGIAHYQQAFWLYAGPASVGMILPAIGIIFEVLIANSRSLTNSRTAIVGSGIGILMLSLVSWSQHLVAAPDGELPVLVGTLFGLLMAIPASFILLVWIRQLALLNRPVPAATLFAVCGIISGLLTGAVGFALAIPALAVYLHNTYFTVAHLHLAMVGTLGSAIFAGVFHFWPSWCATSYSSFTARLSAIGMFVGIGLAFLPMAILGAEGLPRALYVYPPAFRLLHTLSTVGTFILVSSILAAVVCLAWGLRRHAASALALPSRVGEFQYMPTPAKLERK